MNGEVKQSDVVAPSKLNARQKRFCEEYVKEPNATKAAIAAGYTKASATVTSCRLMKQPHIQEYIDALHTEIAARNEITIDSIVKNLRDVYAAAMKDGKFSDANRAMELLGKYLGMFTEHTRTSISVAQGAVTDEEMGAQIGRFTEILGIDLAALQKPSKTVN